jgi:anti-anti-sigma factor
MSSSTDHELPKVEHSGYVRIITFTGDMVRDVENVIAKELDGNVEKLADCHLLLDFTNVKTLNGAELETLVMLHKKMKATGGRLTLFNLSIQVYEVFWAEQLQQRMGICRE